MGWTVFVLPSLLPSNQKTLRLPQIHPCPRQPPTCHPPFAIRSLPSAAPRPPLALCHLHSAIICSQFAIHHSPFLGPVRLQNHRAPPRSRPRLPRLVKIQGSPKPHSSFFKVIQGYSRLKSPPHQHLLSDRHLTFGASSPPFAPGAPLLFDILTESPQREC